MIEKLESIANMFKQWRSKNKNGRIPSQIKQQILQLIKHYPFDQLVNTLGVSRSTLNRWRQLEEEKISSQQSDKFIPLPLDSLPSSTELNEVSENIHLHITLSNNLQLELSGLSLSQVNLFIKTLSTGN